MKSEFRHNVFIVDDHDILREGIRFILTSTGFASISGEARNGEEFLSMLNNGTINTNALILMDISMPVLDGIEASKSALKKYPDLKIIALSMYTDKIYYEEMLKAGVKGIVLKKSGIEELKRAIDTVAAGRLFLPENWSNDSTIDSLF